MTASTPEGNPPDDSTQEEINTGGAGNTDLHGQAREVVEATEEGSTGPTLGGG